VTAPSIRPEAGEQHPDRTRFPAPRRGLPRWLDWVDGADPGLMRLRLAAEIMTAIGFVLLAEWIFARATGALQAPTVIAMMLGAVFAAISGLGLSMCSRARDQAVTLLILPLPLLATLAMGLALHVRLLSLASMAVVMAIGAYCRRFGPRGVNGGVLAFMGAFLGFFIQDYVPLPEFGWLAAETGLAVAVVFAVHFAFFFPRPGAAVRAMQRSYAARTRDVAREMTEVFTETVRGGADERAERRLHRRLLRLNEAALLIDSRLDAPGAVPPGWNAAALHQRLFDAETNLSDVARLAAAIASRGLPWQATDPVRRALTGIRDAFFAQVIDSAATIRALLEDPRAPRLGPDDRVLLHRFAMSVTEFSSAFRDFRTYPDGCPPDEVLREAAPARVPLRGARRRGRRRAARLAAREQLEALAGLVSRCVDRLADSRSRTGSDRELRAAARRADLAYQSLISVVRPMRTPLFGGPARRVAGCTATASAARHYARNLLLDASTRYDDLPPGAIADLKAAHAQFADSVAAITAALRSDGAGEDGTGEYVRSASLFARIADCLRDPEITSRPQLALRDLQLLDGAFASAARWAGLPVTDLDTAQK